MSKINVLISLHRGYGLGDAVQMSAVLRHVAKYRPNWTVDYQAEEGRHCVGQGIVANTFAYGQPYPNQRGALFPYDAEVIICLYDTWANWHDRPNTRVSSCLREHFDLDWDAECGQYRVDVSPKVANAVRLLVGPGGREVSASSKIPHRRMTRVVAVHYQGDSSKTRKDLTHAQAAQVCKEVDKLGCSPLLLDWRDASPLTDSIQVRTTGRISMSREWGADAEYNCAVIAQCAAFVGIDSGPSKCASATDTPSLIVWTGHHPAPFHDPAPNTTHLVPVRYNGLEPVCDDAGVIRWFESHHTVRKYDRDPVREIVAWLKETLTDERPSLAITEQSRGAEKADSRYW